MRAATASTVLAALAGAAVVGAVAGASMSIFWAAPLALGVALALVSAIWRTPVVAAVLVVAVVPAISGLARGLVVPGLKVSEVLLVVCVGALLLCRPARYRSLNGVDLALLLFAVTGLGFAVWHASDGDSELESVLRVGLQPTFLLLAWWAASRGVEKPADLVAVLRWLLLVSLVPSVLAIMQFLDVPGVDATLISLTADGYLSEQSRLMSDRVTGPFTIWHSLGGYLLVPTVLAAVLLLADERRVLSRGWLVAVLLVDLAALVLAVTVTLLLWLPVAFLVAALAARRFTRGLAMAGVLAAVVAFGFSGVLLDRFEQQTTQTTYTQGGVLPQTVEYRILVWERDYLPLLDSAAVAGLGNDLPPEVVFESTENQYITLMLRGGLGLVLTAVVAIAAMAVRSWRHARAPDVPGHDSRPVARAAAQATIGILAFLPFGMLMWPYLTNAGMSQALFAFAGAALALQPRRRSRFSRPTEAGSAQAVGSKSDPAMA